MSAAKPAADLIEDIEFLDSTGVGATETARRSGFPTAHAMEKWLDRHGRTDLWLRLKHRDPKGTHLGGTDRKKRRLMSVSTAATADDDTYARLLANGDESTRARTRAKAERARALLHDLRVILNAEAEEDARRGEARSEVERLTRELAEAKARLRGGATTAARPPATTGGHHCRHEDCGRTFETPQARAMHQRRAHEGFDPMAQKATS